MLPIGDDGLGDFICLGVSSANFGGVYFLDHERHPYDNPNSDEGITQIANSFSEFLLLLEENPE
jgi:hypothetical protein